jgi:hypothetical protein
MWEVVSLSLTKHQVQKNNMLDQDKERKASLQLYADTQ